MRRRIALALVVAAAVCAVVAWRHWIAGTPPTWSYFGDRAEVTILVSEIRDETGSDGKPTHLPHVEVEWPPDTGSAVTLEGVIPHHVARMLWTAEQLVGNYQPGDGTTVRVVGGRPFADQTDITEMTYAVFFSVLAVAAIAGAAVLAIRKPRIREDGAWS